MHGPAGHTPFFSCRSDVSCQSLSCNVGILPWATSKSASPLIHTSMIVATAPLWSIVKLYNAEPLRGTEPCSTRNQVNGFDSSGCNKLLSPRSNEYLANCTFASEPMTSANVREASCTVFHSVDFRPSPCPT